MTDTIVFDIPVGTPPALIYTCLHCMRLFTCLGRRRKYCSDICSRRGSKGERVDIPMAQPIVGSKGAKIGEGTVYVIGHSNVEGPVKIGKSAGIDNAYNRLKDIQIGNPNRLSILGSIDVEDCDLIENLMHNLFTDSRMTGEWFDIQPNEALRALGIRRAIDDIIPSMCKVGALNKLFRPLKTNE